jgi:mRNA-degrading endonuclease RelE of RelBE toxin-antitoxin system
MTVIPTKDFNKSIEKLKDKVACRRLDVLITKLEQAKNLQEISNVKAMVNYPHHYRIRTSEYRLIIEQIDTTTVEILLLEYLKRDEKTYKF